MKDFATKTRLLANQQTEDQREEEFSYAKAVLIGIGFGGLLLGLYLIAIGMFAM